MSYNNIIFGNTNRLFFILAPIRGWLFKSLSRHTKIQKKKTHEVILQKISLPFQISITLLILKITKTADIRVLIQSEHYS